jgi:hypothetical protein
MPWFVASLLLLANSGAASAGCATSELSGVAVVTGTERAWFYYDAAFCPKGQAYCRKRSYLIPGDRVVTGTSQDGYTCVTMPGNNTTGWIETKRLRPQEIVSSPPSSAWAGDWESEASIIEIRHNEEGLWASGVDDWKSGDGHSHSAEFSGLMRSGGNHARLEEDSCRVEFTLLNEYMIVEDETSCGANTSFRGVYRRKPKRR